jgi:hypothetical protein
VIPKTLASQGRRAQGKEPDQNSIPVPGGELALARRGERPIQGGEQEILAHRSPLVAFGCMSVNDSYDVQLLGYVPKRGGGAKIPLLGVERATRGLRQEFEQFLSGAEMAEHAQAGSSALIPEGFDDAPVAFPAHGVGLEARHDSYIQ